MDAPVSNGPVRKYRSSQAYFYPTDPAVVVCAAATPAPQATLRIDTEADFELLYLGAAADVALAGQTDSTRVIPLVTLQIQQSGGNLFMPNPIPLSLISGDGRLPFIMPEPILLPANSNLTLQFNRYGAVDYNLRLAFIGRKLYFG